LFARHVRGLAAAHVEIHLAAADARPAIQCEDAGDLKFSDWNLFGNAAGYFGARLDSVHNAVFTGFSPPLAKIEGEGNNRIRVEAR